MIRCRSFVLIILVYAMMSSGQSICINGQTVNNCWKGRGFILW